MSISLLPKQSSNQRGMDAPIYLLFLDMARRQEPYSNRYKWYVIEEKATPSTAPGVELSKDLLWCSNDHDTVRHLSLPDLDYNVVNSNHVSTVVSDSRLFFIGGTSGNMKECNGIISIDFHDNILSWHQCDRWIQQFSRTDGAVYSKQDDRIYVLNAFNGKVLSFDCRNIEEGQVLSVPSDLRNSFLVASTDGEMLMCKRDGLEREFSFFRIKSSFTSSSRRFQCVADHPPYYRYGLSVVFREEEGEYVVCFSRHSPLIKTDVDNYCPGLYVYDIRLGQWLPQPVQGLRNDGVILPTLDMEFIYASLMRVNVDKFALVWVRHTQNENGTYTRETDVYWSKFILLRKVDEKGTIFYYSDILSYGNCSGGTSSFIRSAVDVGALEKL